MNSDQLDELDAICASVPVVDEMAEVLNVRDEDDNWPLEVLEAMSARGMLSDELTRIFSRLKS
jgi:hypothetical protein